MEQLDALDRKILSELDRDSRQHYSAIAKKLKAGKDRVKYRIEKLAEIGIIRGFYTVIDYSKLGFLSFRFYFQLSHMGWERKGDLIHYLKNHKNISIFYRITGKYDLSFSMWARNVWEYEEFWEEFNTKFGRHVSDSHLAIKTKYSEFTRTYLGGKEKEQFTVSEKGEKEKLDELDFRLLGILSSNARTPLTELAAKAKTSVVTCRSRIRKLTKSKVIVAFRTMLDLAKLGYNYYKVDLWFDSMEKQKEIINAVLSHPNVIYTEKTVLTSDFEFDLEVQNFQQFVSIMDGIEKKFHGSIKRYEYYTLIENYKTNYLPTA